MSIVWWLIRLVAFLLLLLFALQNQHPVELHGLFGGQVSWPLSWLLALTLLLGAVLGVVAMLPRVLRRKRAAAPVPATSTAQAADDGLGV